MGAATGGAIGAAAGDGGAGVFEPLVEEVKDALPHGSSALMLVADKPTADQLVSAVGSHGRRVIEQEMTGEQVRELTRAGVR